MKLFFIFSFLIFSLNLFSKSFKNNFISFQVPSSWECLMEGTEWVCQSKIEERSKEAIIIFAAKRRGQKDGLAYYKSYLSKKKQYKLPGNQQQVSDQKYTRVNQINDHRWIDSLHLSSEIPGYYTRYLATVKEDLGVAVTFSVVADKYRKYKNLFDKIVSSVRVFRQRSVKPNSSRKKRIQQAQSSLLDETEFLSEEKFDLKRNRGQGSSKSSIEEGKDYFLYIIIGLVLVGFILLRKK